MPLFFPSEAISLIHELSDPVPAPLRSRFFERVRGLLRDDEILHPGEDRGSLTRRFRSN